MRVLYRADGGHPIGTGHLFRAARILQELSRRGPLEATLAYAEDESARRIACTAPASQVVLPPRTDLQAIKPKLSAGPVVDLIRAGSYDLVVVDMLDTPGPDMAALRATGIPLVTLDDRGEGRRHADTIINILVKEPDSAGLRPGTRLLEGGDYVVLDPLYADAHGSYPGIRPDNRRILVAMGGADAAGLTVRVAEALAAAKSLDAVELAIGPAFPHRPALESALSGAPWEWTIHSGLPSLLERYLACDLAVVAGGLTMYEVCCVGVPALAVCQPIDHQVELADELSAQGAMATVGYGLEASHQQISSAVSDLAADAGRRRAMAVRGPALVDGCGTMRVADALIETASRGTGGRH